MQVAQLLLEQQLKAGLVKSTDLDALINIRDELNKSTIDYRTMLESSQRRLQQLAEDEQVARIGARRKKTRTSRLLMRDHSEKIYKISLQSQRQS